MKPSLAFASALLVAGTLAGCGNDTEAYCQSLEETKEEFGAIEGTDLSQLDDAFERVQSLGEEAPDEVKDEWETLNGSITRMQDALAEAGIEFSDLEGITQGELPEGVDQADLRQLATDMQAFSGPEVQEATDVISQHAQDECGIDLTGA